MRGRESESRELFENGDHAVTVWGANSENNVLKHASLCIRALFCNASG